MGISLRRLGRGLRDGTAIPRFYNRLIVEGSLPAVAFDGQQFVLPAYGPDLYSSTTTGTVTVEPGKLYELSATGSGSITIALGTAASGTNILAAATYATARYFTPVSSTTHVTVTVTSGSLTDILIREVILGDMGTNLGASGYTMSVNGGTGTATESPSGTLNLTGDGSISATADMSFTCVVGRHYRVVFFNSTAQSPAVAIGTTQGGAQVLHVNAAALAVNFLEFTATATTHWIRFRRQPASLTTISSITIAEWTPRPTLRSATFSEVFAYTCSSAAGVRTRTDSDGLIKADVGVDQPRWDYSSGKARLLLEPQSTNSILRSAEFDNASWTKSLVTASANTTTAPDGTLTADTITPTTGVDTHRVSQTYAATAASATVSFYAKPNGYSKIGFYEASSTTAAASFNLTGAGSVIFTSLATATITAVANGWYRCTVTYTGTAATNMCMLMVLDNGYTSGAFSSRTYAGDGVSGIHLWGAQVELGQAYATSYIPTTSATVTRLIETARFSPLVEAIATQPAVTVRVQGTLLSAQVNMRVLGVATFNAILRADGTTASTIGTGTGSLTATSILPGPFGAAVALNNSSGQSLSANGGAATSSTTAAASRAALCLARGGTVDASNPYGAGYYSSFALWPFRIANANLPALAVAPS